MIYGLRLRVWGEGKMFLGLRLRVVRIEGLRFVV